jgi:ABC-2 type transport system ATP-binding protein
MDTENVITINGLSKIYSSGHHTLKALDNVNLTIKRGEIFALLGPNGAGKTTLINAICGIINPSQGSILADGHNIIKDYRHTRSKIGLVPQELSTDMFEKVLSTVRFSRNLFGKATNDSYLETVLRDLALWDRRESKIMTLSGGMKRRVMIAKALAHEPEILFLDEPSAGVDVELRRGMWQMVRKMRDNGVTIILTTHYIEEAEEMADRVGVINKGKLILVEQKSELMKKLGKKELKLILTRPLIKIPEGLKDFSIQLLNEGTELLFTYDSKKNDSGITTLLKKLEELSITFKDLQTKESSLEEIFVQLVGK